MKRSHDKSDSQIDWLVVTRRVASGDMDAYAIYYEHFFDLMHHETSRLLRLDEHSILDIVHDAMLKAGKSMKPIDGLPRLTAWTQAVVKSVAYDWLRKRRRMACLELVEQDCAVEQEFDGEMELTARSLWLEEQLLQLPDELRQLVDFRYRLGWTLKKIGERFGKKPGAIDGQLRRLVAKIRAAAENESKLEFSREMIER